MRHEQTNVDHIYAIGDIIDGEALEPPSQVRASWLESSRYELAGCVHLALTLSRTLTLAS